MNSFAKKLTSLLICLVLLLTLGIVNFSLVLAHSDDEDVEPPNFPSCADKLSVNGDWAHYDVGSHNILSVGLRDGRDDVYKLDSGNFLQCFCPTTGTEGIQTNWWNVQRCELSQSKIDSFKSQGWLEEDGGNWNLHDETYLAKNVTFQCRSAASPTPTPTIVVTPTQSQSSQESRCFDLEASPSEGVAPLTVKFTGHADDPVSGGRIKEYRFDFGDSSGGQPQVWHQTDRVAYHRYERSGEYEAKLRVQDNAGNWRESDDCKVKIKVSNAPQVLGAQTPSELPQTGATLLLATISPLIAVAGRYLYKRFKLI